jgi:ketol-acid reductoisomerase
MADMLAEIRAGRFAEQLASEEANNYPRLHKAREDAKALAVERAFRTLQA